MTTLSLDNEDPVTPETRVCEKRSEWPWSSDVVAFKSFGDGRSRAVDQIRKRDERGHRSLSGWSKIQGGPEPVLDEDRVARR